MQNKKYKNSLILIFALYAFSFILLLSGCQKPMSKKENVEEVVPVLVEKVKLKNISEALEYSGNIKAQDEALVYPKVSGKVITKVKEDGQFVEKDEPLIYLDRDETGLKFEKAPVESPLAGLVGRIYVDIGQNVLPQTPVALVLNLEKVKLNLDIPEKYLSKVNLGQEAEIFVDAYADEKFSGFVTKISPVLDLATRTAPIEITLDNPDYKLKSGMFAKVRLILKEYKAVPVILKEAIIGKEPDTYVYVIENNHAFLRKITLGLRQGPYYQVLSGLKEGEYVVIMGQQRLKEAKPVIVEEKKDNLE